jgi:hypothetical protein
MRVSSAVASRCRSTLRVNQETIGKFERGQRWPRDPDRTIAAYAEDLDIEPFVLWREALRRWEREQ